jgi:hypothetical protein
VSEPIFQTVFGERWHDLPLALQQRYANRPFSNDVVTIDGFLTVEMSRLSKLMAPIFYLTGTLVPYHGENIPVTVEFKSERGSDACHFDRTFRFPGRRPYRFRSTLRPRRGAEIVERMPIGIGWHARYSVDDGKVCVEHLGYGVGLFGRFVRIPLEWIFGRGTAEEEAIDEHHFRMAMEIVHPLLGKVYGYRGTFSITSVAVAD